MKSIILMSAALLSLIFAKSQHVPPRPTAPQLAWHEQEFYLFAHFGPNTFTGAAWGHGDEPEDIFNPTKLNTDQWFPIAKPGSLAAMEMEFGKNC